MLNFKNMATVSMLNNPSISSSHMLLAASLLGVGVGVFRKIKRASRG